MLFETTIAGEVTFLSMQINKMFLSLTVKLKLHNASLPGCVGKIQLTKQLELSGDCEGQYHSLELQVSVDYMNRHEWHVILSLLPFYF